MKGDSVSRSSSVQGNGCWYKNNASAGSEIVLVVAGIKSNISFFSTLLHESQTKMKLVVEFANDKPIVSSTRMTAQNGPSVWSRRQNKVIVAF